MSRVGFNVNSQHFLIIHPIEMVPSKNQDIIVCQSWIENIGLIVLDGIRCALIPLFAHQRLLRCEDLDEPAAIRIKAVRLRNMSIQGDRVELGQDVNFLQS